MDNAFEIDPQQHTLRYTTQNIKTFRRNILAIFVGINISKDILPKNVKRKNTITLRSVGNVGELQSLYQTKLLGQTMVTSYSRVF